MNHQLILMPSGRRAQVATGTSLLDAARTMGVEIESICGGKLTCGKCLVRPEVGVFAKHGIVSGADGLSTVSAEESALIARKSQEENLRCACTARVQGDMLVFVPQASRAQKQVIRKAASGRVMRVNSVIRQVYVEVVSAEVDTPQSSDWQRLQNALAEQWGLQNLTIDLFALQTLQKQLRSGKWKVTVTLRADKDVLEVRAGYDEGLYGLAVDIGSTTVAAHLCDLSSGEVLATAAAMNPQITFGEDLMSRISYVMLNKDGTRRMHRAIITALNRLAADAAQQVGLTASQIHDVVFVGNTTMVNLLLGIDPVELGGTPFALAVRDALDVQARDLKLRFHPAANVHILPAEAGHVGADNVAAVLAEALHEREEVTLLVDVGTNAEIVIGNKDGLWSASSPTGPAFEGAQIAHGMRAAPGAIERVRIDPVTFEARYRIIGSEQWSNEGQVGTVSGICGSGIIEAVAEMFRVGIIAADGRVNSAYKTDKIVWEGRKGMYELVSAEANPTGSAIFVTQDDVRNIQLAKAALYTGCKLLMRRAGIEKIDRIVLAGAFGSFIDPKYAMLLGLIPDCDLAAVSAVGNAAGEGARMALLDRDQRTTARQLARTIRYIELAVDPDFQDAFVEAIHLPHKTDKFPHLGEFLPRNTLPVEKKRRRRRRRAGTMRANSGDD